MESHITRVVNESKRASEGCSFALAERKGFEPLLEDYSKHDFQSCALDQLSHLSVQVAIRRRVGRTPATCVFYHTSQDLSRGFPKNAEKKLTVDRNLLYSRSVLAPCGSPGRFRLTGMPVAPTAMAQNFLSGNVRTAGGFPLLPVPDKPPDDQHYDCRQHRADQYNCHVPLYPFPHTAFSFVVPSVSEKVPGGRGLLSGSPRTFPPFLRPAFPV